MKFIERVAVVVCTGFLAAAAAAGCGGGPSARGDSEPVGSITLDLTLAPPDAKCAVITVVPQMGMTVTRQIMLMPESAATVTLTGLPTGAVTITEQVFTVACAMVGTMMPTWVADPVMVSLDPGGGVTVTFNLRRTDASGQVTVISNFPAGQAPTIREFTVPNAPFFLAVGPDDNLWFSDVSLPGGIERFALGGATTPFPILDPTNQIAGPLTAGPDGNIWFGLVNILTNQRKIARMTTAGTAIVEFAVSTSGAITGETKTPGQIKAGADGNLWFSDADNNKIGRITTGGAVTLFNVPTANSQPYGIAAGPDGNIWFTEGTGNKVGRITPGGTITEFTIPTPNAFPQTITAGPDGNLWFVESNSGRIGRITTSGSIAEFVVPTAGSLPIGIATGSDGNVWFTEGSANKVARITPAGVITELIIPSFDSHPREIVNGPDANPWFTEFFSGKVAQIQIHP